MLKLASRVLLTTALAVTANTEASFILAAINDMSKRLEDRFDNLETSLQAIQSALAEHDGRISTVEAASSDYDIRLTKLKWQWLQLEASHKSPQEKVIDLEAWSRRQNINVVSLPERAEGKNPVGFFDKFLHDLLGSVNFPNLIAVNRAHRLGRPSDAGAQPHIMTARIHSYGWYGRMRRWPTMEHRSTYTQIFRRRHWSGASKSRIRRKNSIMLECAPDFSTLHGSESPKVPILTRSSTPQKMPIDSCLITVLPRRGDVFALDCLIYAGCCILLQHRLVAVYVG